MGHKSAIIVGVCSPEESVEQISNDLEELALLLETLKVKVRGKVTQKRQRLTARYLIGSGKLDEIRELAEGQQVDMIVFDRSLTALQVRNIEKRTCKDIFDRTGIILEIFSRHARSNQAKTQVEIAQLEYLLPRLTGAWTHFQRQAGGGVRSRGMGEKQIEIDRRRAREKIAKLQTRLRQIRTEKQVQRKARSGEFKVALVGYTNSGKTTLMQNLTRSLEMAKDELFATLDTNIKVLDPKTHPKVLVSDTVGFIRNLPHSLIESFKSTLDEVCYADLLLHVVDASHARYKDHMITTQQVLNEVGAGDVPMIVIFNKLDLIDHGSLQKVLKAAYPDSMQLSARSSHDMKALRRFIFDYFRKKLLTVDLWVSKSHFDKISIIYQSCLILSEEYEGDEAIFKVQATAQIIEKIKQFAEMRSSNGSFEYR